MRKAFADTLCRLAEQDDKLVFLTGDLGYQVFDEFRQRFGPRYINVGIAEAQMVCCAAGLALEGWHPIVYSIASFATGRAFEQIRVSVSYPGLPVVVVGAGGGYTYATSGVTHHAAEDLALMSLLPGFTVVVPGDRNEVADLLPQVMSARRPAYFRVGRYGEGEFLAEEPAVLGRARLIRSGGRVLLLTTGDLAVEVAEALRLLEAADIHPRTFQLHTVKPLDTVTLQNALADIHCIAVVEEQVPTGGLAASVSSWQTSRAQPLPVVRLGPPDALALGNPKRETLRRRLGYDARAIAESVTCLWNAADPENDPALLVEAIR
jgi:transketolase